MSFCKSELKDMAKMFYTLAEATEKLGCSEDEVRQLVKDGKLREFRDAGKINFKVSEIDALPPVGSSKPEVKPEAKPSEAPVDTSADSSDDLAGDSLLDLISETGADMTGVTDVAKGLGADAGKARGIDAGTEGIGGWLADLSGLSSTGEATALEPADTGGTEAGESSDVLTLDEADKDSAAQEAKEDTVITSVGISVFDEANGEGDVDPSAATVASTGDKVSPDSSGSAALSETGSGTGLLDASGGGSGLLDMARENDDTSLGADLLEDIYPEKGEEPKAGSGAPEMGDETRAGLEASIDTEEEEAEAKEEIFEPVAAPAAEEIAKEEAVAIVSELPVEADAMSFGMTGLMIVGVLVLAVAGMSVAAFTRDVWPQPLEVLNDNIWFFGLGALVAAGLGLGIGLLLGKRSQG